MIYKNTIFLSWAIKPTNVIDGYQSLAGEDSKRRQMISTEKCWNIFWVAVHLDFLNND